MKDEPGFAGLVLHHGLAPHGDYILEDRNAFCTSSGRM
jgi:hypothetical protein